MGQVLVLDSPSPFGASSFKKRTRFYLVMDPLEKLEMIIEGNIRKRTADRAKSANKASSLDTLELDEEITSLRQVLGEIDAITRNVPSVSDEIVQKRYGQSNK